MVPFDRVVTYNSTHVSVAYNVDYIFLLSEFLPFCYRIPALMLLPVLLCIMMNCGLIHRGEILVDIQANFEISLLWFVRLCRFHLEFLEES